MAKYVTKARVREFLKKKKMRMGSDLESALDSMIEQALSNATIRATDNRRQTVRASDL